MAKQKEQIEVIDRGGAKTVEKKRSFVVKVRIAYAVFAVVWIALFAAAPLIVKAKYSEPIKKSIVVGMFFDMQRQISKQYEAMLAMIKKNVNLEKPINAAIEKMKVADKGVASVQNTTAKATTATNKLSGAAAKLGVKAPAVNTVQNAVAKVDDTASAVNAQLDKVKAELNKTAQAEVDKMIDEEIRKVANKGLGGLGDTLLTNYGIKHVYPWKPSSWPVAAKIYADLMKSSSGTVNTIMATVNSYFGYVAWGLVVIFWLIGLLGLIFINGKVGAITKGFLVCPRCGHAYADKRTAMGILKLFKPWKWI
ncbi:MAG: hypothetical protein LBH81_03015 [Rickettsiales bacterium]|jgi:hypothetical protein|nr:hypothetical protein [Rickettsiales bacterium]